MDIYETTARIIAIARDDRQMTAAEFDYQISIEGIGGPLGWLGNAAWQVANGAVGRVASYGAGEVAHRELWDAVLPELERYAAKCRSRKYSGWSAAAQARGSKITYAN